MRKAIHRAAIAVGAGSSSRSGRPIVALAVASAICVLPARTSVAANGPDTWQGNTSVLWSAGGNWSPTTNAPPISGDSLVFGAAGSSGLTLTDDLMTPINFNVAGITFNSGAGAFVINPNASGFNGFALTGSLINNSVALETINDLIGLSATQTITTNTGNITLGGAISSSGAFGITKTGSGTLTLSAANSYTGTTTISAGTLALSGGTDTLLNTGTVNFSGTSTLNIGNISQTLANLTVANSFTGTVNGSGGALTLTGSAFRLGSSTAQGNQTLTMSGLSSFSYNNAGGSFAVGQNFNSGTASTDTLTLAVNNNITALTFDFNPVSSTLSTGDTGTINLGQTNTINADTISIAALNRANDTLKFQSLTSPSLTLRGTAGGSTRANMTVGSQNSAGVGDTGTVDLTTGVTGTGTLDAMLGTLTIGKDARGSSAGTNTMNVTGAFTMGGGTLDASTILLGQIVSGADTTSTSASTTTGTFTFGAGGGTVKVGTMTLGDMLTASTNTHVNIVATVNLNNGGILQAQTIQAGASATAPTVRTFNWNDGTIENYRANATLSETETDLTISSGMTWNIASTGTHTFDISSGHTATVNSALAGAGGTLAKANFGTVVLAAANTYTGATTISAGTLAFGNGGSLANTAVTVSSGATLAAAPGLNGGTTGATNSLAGTLTLNAGAKLSMADGITSTFNATNAGTITLAPTSGSPTNLTFDIVGGASSTSDVLAITGAASVGNATAFVTFNGIGASPLTTTSFNFITAASGLGSNFNLSTTRLVVGGTLYSLALSGSGTTETVTATASGGNPNAYFDAAGGSSALNALNGSTTNFSSDPNGTSDSGSQPGLLQDVYFTATNVSTPQTITSLGTSYTWNSLNFTAGSPSVSISDGSSNTLTLVVGITDASSNAQTVNVPITFSSPATITNSGANTLTLGGGITAGTNLLTFAGSGATTLSGANAFTTSTGVTVNPGAGIVTISSPITLGGASTFSNNSSNNLILSGGTISNGGFLLTIAGAGNTALSGNISGGGGLAMSGQGILTLSGSNSYGGATTLSAGTVALSGGANRLPTATTVNFTGSATLDIGATSQTLANLTVANGFTGTVNGNGGTLTLSNANFTLGSATASSVQTLNLSALGNFVNTSSGTFNVGGSAASGGAGSSATMTLAAANTITAATLSFGGNGGGGTGSPKNAGTLNLGQSNAINASAINVGINFNTALLQFASGLTSPTLTIRATDTVGRATMIVGQAGSNPGGSAAVDLVTGVTGTSSLDALLGTLTLGDANRGGSQTTVANITATFTMGAGTLDATSIALAEVTAGSGSSSATGLTNTGTFTTGSGAVKVATLSLGDQNSTIAGTKAFGITAAFNLNNGGILQATTIQPGNSAGTGSYSRSFNWNNGTIENYRANATLGEAETNLTISAAGTSPTVWTLASTGTHTFDIDSGFTGNVSAILAGAGGTLVKANSGTLVLAAANTYSGATTVSGGTLSITGSLGNTAVSVQSSAVVGGGIGAANLGVIVPADGTATLGYYTPSSTAGGISGSVTVGANGHLAPTSSTGLVGTLSPATLTLNSTSKVDIQFNGSANSLIDVTASGGLTLSTGVGVNLYQEGTLSAFDTPGTYHLIEYLGSLGGVANNLAVTNQDGTSTYAFGTSTVGGNQFLDLTITPAPEPATLGLLALGSVGLLARRRRGAMIAR